MPPAPLPLDIPLFEWFDHNAWGHWLVAWSVLALVLATALAPLAEATGAGTGPLASSRPLWLRILGSKTLFVIGVILVFCAFRWPLWFAGPLANPDEAEWIAGALTLRDGGLPWKSIDCHTSGPLNAATLLLTIPLGLPLNYVGVRVLTSLLQAASVLALWGAARRFFPEGVARLAILPAINLWACRWFHDIGQYSSEQTSVLLLALAGWAGAVAFTTGRPRLRIGLLVVAGALTTAPLFAKPQSAPLCAALGLVLLGAVVLAPSPATTEPPSRRQRTHRAAALALGAAAPLAILFAYLGLYGLTNQFRIFYWQSNVLYTSERSFALSDSVEALGNILGPVTGSTASVLGALAFGLIALVPAFIAQRTGRGRLLAAWLLVAAALVAVIGPGRIQRMHYLHYLVIPLSWLTAVSLAGTRDFLLQLAPATRRPLAWLALAFLLVTTAWPVWQTATQYRPMNGQLYFWRGRQVSPAGARLRELAAPGDKLVVWGWAPGFYVESGLGQGCRDAHCGLIIDAGPLQSNYRDRFLFDLRRNRPRWFVDAVAPGQFGYRDRSLFGHDAWPELRSLVAAEYDLVDEFDGVRIYRRRPQATDTFGRNNLAPPQPAP